MIKPVKEIRIVNIASVHNGYIVTVGCQRFVYTNANELLADLSKYIHTGSDLEDELMAAHRKENPNLKPSICEAVPDNSPLREWGETLPSAENAGSSR